MTRELAGFKRMPNIPSSLGWSHKHRQLEQPIQSELHIALDLASRARDGKGMSARDAWTTKLLLAVTAHGDPRRRTDDAQGVFPVL